MGQFQFTAVRTGCRQSIQDLSGLQIWPRDRVNIHGRQAGDRHRSKPAPFSGIIEVSKALAPPSMQ
jgi:hypothetical protein